LLLIAGDDGGIVVDPGCIIIATGWTAIEQAHPFPALQIHQGHACVHIPTGDDAAVSLFHSRPR
jgi:hypothetical protein